MHCNSAWIEYLIHIIFKKADVAKSSGFFDKKYDAISLYTRSKAEANSIAIQSSHVLYNSPISTEEKQTCPAGVLSEGLAENCGTLMNLATFVNVFCQDENASKLTIRINENDIEGFRLASFIASYCIERKKIFSIKDYDNKELLPLYEPHISSSTKFLLFSLIDYWLKNGKFPIFDELKDHHFKNFDIIESEKTRWNSSSNSQFVSTIYASLRAMQRLSLIQKEFHETKRKMICIKPTINGLLSVLFSSYFEQFKSSPTFENENEGWDENDQ